jgi:hypothetical protein
MKHKIFTVLMLGTLLLPQSLFATGVSLSVSPTLFEMSAVPSQAWNSSVQVINNNPQDITVYASVVNFAPQGETGSGKFLPVFESFTEGKTLAEWITVSDEPYLVSRKSSVSIPIILNVPEDAAPGGHYAAIMVGTRPVDRDQSFQVATLQIVTSLFFVRVAGDVVESGVIRTFRAEESFVDIPEIDFEVRFENKGNVHLQPQGNIVITNMWGKERGIVPINHQTHFGNVLPDSIRQFKFSWKGEQSFVDIGRYKAILTLAYGQNEPDSVTEAIYFWVIPIKSVLTMLSSLIVILLLVSWSVRVYIKRVLELLGPQRNATVPQRIPREGDVLVRGRASVGAPISGGVSDIKDRLARTQAFLDTMRTLIKFISLYKKFFGSVLLLGIAFIVIWYYLTEVTTIQRDYEITIDNRDTKVILSSEEIIYDTTEAETPVKSSVELEFKESPQVFELMLINSSDTPGVAAVLQQELEAQGYVIESLKSDFEKSKSRSVIVYDVDVQAEALALSQILGGVLLSARPSDTETVPSTISIYIGNEFSIE